MKTELAFDTMERVLPYIVEFSDDPDFDKLRNDLRNKKITKTADIAPRLVDIFIKKHRDATLNIVAGISGKSAAEISVQEFERTLEDAGGELLDQMIGFFGWCLRFLQRM